MHAKTSITILKIVGSMFQKKFKTKIHPKNISNNM